MKQNDNSTRCKQCGKVIVGNSKLGLCDRCFNKDATTGAGVIAGIWGVIQFVVKPIIKFFTRKK